ncbi:GntR family transcriptional regulator [Streptomyces sp. NPDC091217]|uniref:GntR family transcriptional regulator n=1 Tax=Streptomyces sp. NPDC091217 TaxID=3365975 RepID=UPI003830AABC
MTTTPKTEPRGDESLSDRVISEVRERIITQALRPDQPFTEGEIAGQLGVSKSPVREALSLLRRQGWVQVLPRSGYRVAPLTLHDAQSLMTIRLALEPEAAALAAQRSHRWPEQVQLLQDYAQAAVPASDTGDMAVQHYRFHKRIAVLSGSEEMDRILSEVLLKLRRYDSLDIVGDAAPEVTFDHQDLAAAIAERNMERARELSAEHVRSARDALLTALMSSDQLMSANLALGSTTAQRLVS